MMKILGPLKTLGEVLGEIMDMLNLLSKLLDLEFVVFNNMLLILNYEKFEYILYVY